MDTKIITRSAEETVEWGKKFAKELKPTVVCLYGELGSGKTTFTQGFAKGLGISSRLLSPTFIIVRRYGIKPLPGFLYHVDLYRLQKKEDLEGLGLPEMFADRSSYAVIEWAEKLGDFLPKSRVDIHFALEKNGSHSLKVRHV